MMATDLFHTGLLHTFNFYKNTQSAKLNEGSATEDGMQESLPSETLHMHHPTVLSQRATSRSHASMTDEKSKTLTHQKLGL